MMQATDHAPTPGANYARVPFALFSDAPTFERERAALFRGPTWNYLGLAVEIPNPGDYLLGYVGDIQIVVNRTPAGGIAAFENSCAHRGAQLVRRVRGNAAQHAHTCPYHQWRFDTAGALLSVPQERGVKGKGGMPADFDRSRHGLRTLRVEVYKGLIFGTFAAETLSLHDYLGPKIRPEIDRIFDRPVVVLGHWRQAVPANWKLYLENVKDPYHASLLHLYHTTFGIYRATMSGRVIMDDTCGHSVLRTADIGENPTEMRALYKDVDTYRPGYKLKDPSLFDVKPDYDDRVTNMIMTVFPNLMLGQVAGTFQTRHVRPKGVDAFELYWTYLGFASDDAAAREGRLRQANFVGPAGYISLEDGEAGRLVQRGTHGLDDRASVVEMGGNGAIADQDTLATEVAVRGFWKRYHALMRAAA
jgi:anthranilate 1,2-dioxygenase large subunit